MSIITVFSQEESCYAEPACMGIQALLSVLDLCRLSFRYLGAPESLLHGVLPEIRYVWTNRDLSESSR